MTTAHPVWCEPSRCGVDTGSALVEGEHRSALIWGQFDRHSGTSVAVWLWSSRLGMTYLQFASLDGHNEGIALNLSQGSELARTITHLVAIASQEKAPDDSDAVAA